MALASLNLLFRTDITDYSRKLKRAESQFKRFGKQMQNVGKTMTRNVTLPLLAIGAASVKMASDVDASFTKIETLVGLSRTQVNGMREDISKLSDETGRSSKELADALFVVTSAGIRGAGAMEIMERSAKAAAIGLGETKDIARATTAVIQAYGAENLNAAKATEILLATIREGNLEASALSPVLGRVIGLASQLGVSFEEVGASVATFTRLGVSAEEAITGLRGIMNALIKPTEQSREALISVGLTFADLRRKVEGQGLARTLVELMKLFKGNDEQLAALIPNVRALSTVLGTAGAQSEEYVRILESIESANDLVDKGFKRTAETAAFKFTKALNDLKNVGIEIGNKLLPVAVELAKKISTLADKFTELSDAQVINRLKILGLVAAMGPLLIGLGSLLSILPKIAMAWRAVAVAQLAATAAMAANPIGAAALAVAAASVALWGFVKSLKGAKTAQEELNTAIEAGLPLLERQQKVFQNLTLAQLEDKLKGVQRAYDNLRPGLESTKEALMTQILVLEDLIATNKELSGGGGGGVPKVTRNIFEMNKVLVNPEAIQSIKNQIFSLQILVKTAKGLGASAEDVKDFTDEIEKLEDKLPKEEREFPTVTGGGIIDAPILGGSGFDILNEGAKTVGESFDTLGEKIFSAWSMGSEGMQAFIEKFNIDADAIDLTINELSMNFADLGAGLVNIFDRYKEATEGLIGSSKEVAAAQAEAAAAAKNSARAVVRSFIAEGIAAIIANTLKSPAFGALGPLALPIAAAAGAGAGLLFNSLIPSFAEGGAAFGPTLAIVGDNPGARHDPEIIAPLSKLSGMGGGQTINIVGETRMGFDAIYIAWKKHNDFKNRT